jgi:hypothetical protein
MTQENPFAPLVLTTGDNRQRFTGPPVVPASRGLIDYPGERAAHSYEPESFQAVPPSGTPAKLSGLRVVTLDLSVVHTDVLLGGADVGGNIIFFQYSANVTDKITLKADTKDAQPIPLLPGGKIQGFTFDRLYFSNAAIAGAAGAVLLIANVPDAYPDFE